LKFFNSRTFKDLQGEIQGLSRPYSVFKDFPGPGKKAKMFLGLSKTCSHPVYLKQQQQIIFSITLIQPLAATRNKNKKANLSLSHHNFTDLLTHNVDGVVRRIKTRMGRRCNVPSEAEKTLTAHIR